MAARRFTHTHRGCAFDGCTLRCTTCPPFHTWVSWCCSSILVQVKLTPMPLESVHQSSQSTVHSLHPSTPLTFVAHAGAVARAVAPRGITDPSARTSHRRLMCFHFAPCRLVQRFHEPRACQYVIAVLAIPICASGVLCLCYGFRALSCCYLHCCALKTATHAASLTSLTPATTRILHERF